MKDTDEGQDNNGDFRRNGEIDAEDEENQTRTPKRHNGNDWKMLYRTRRLRTMTRRPSSPPTPQKKKYTHA